MAPLFLILALIVQCSFTLANIDEDDKEIISRDVLNNTIEIDDDVVKDFHKAKKDWMDMFIVPDGIYPTSSATLMAQATDSDKSLEEQLEDIKEMANKITLAIQSEMANLLSYALCSADKEKEENGTRKRRSVETPMDSTQLVIRLLKHIKSNNEYQNIAIEKMMSAQEIADKYGIEFNPDPEILSDLAISANEHAKELTDILKDACDVKNVTQHVEFVPFEEQYCPVQSNPDPYYAYSVNPQADFYTPDAFPSYEYSPEQINIQPSAHHAYYPDHAHYNHHLYETPVATPVHHASVTPRPNYYESMMGFTPAQDFYPYCMEPITTTTTIVLPIEEPVAPEPKLIGEEYEETVSSKVFVDHEDGAGSSTVNHVMTYTLSEKTHFRTPEIEKLPQQVQYTFFLI